MFTKMGTQLWLQSAIALTELMIILKFEWNTVTKPLPRHISILWLTGLLALLTWTVHHFYLHRIFLRLENKLRKSRRSRKRQNLAGHETMSSESDPDETLMSDFDGDAWKEKKTD